MEFRPLDLTVLSAKDLKDVNLMSKMDVYVVVSISGDPRTAQKTPVDKDGGTNPAWNFPMKFTVDNAAASADRVTIVFKIMSDRSLGDREVGEVHVPVKELLDAIAPAGEAKKADDGAAAPPPPERVVSYSVRTPKGKSKGTLEFRYRFGDKYTVAAPPPPPPVAAYETKAGNEPVTAYPAMAYPAMGHTGSSSAYPPPGGYPPQGGYPAGYPPQPQPGYGYPGQYPYGQPGYGGYPPQKPPKKSGGSKLGLGLAGGLLGGLLIGDMIGDVGEMGAYDAGFDDGAGFDF